MDKQNTKMVFSNVDGEVNDFRVPLLARVATQTGTAINSVAKREKVEKQDSSWIAVLPI